MNEYGKIFFSSGVLTYPNNCDSPSQCTNVDPNTFCATNCICRRGYYRISPTDSCQTSKYCHIYNLILVLKIKIKLHTRTSFCNNISDVYPFSFSK